MLAKKQIITLLSASFVSCAVWAEAKAPSSEIPAKREFPVNESVNPCENFHQYVCSKVEASFKLRDDRSRHTFSFSDSSERILEAKKDFFKNIDKRKNLSPRAVQIKNIYLACMDEKSGAELEKKNLEQLKKDIAQLKSAQDIVDFYFDQIQEGKNPVASLDAFSNQDNPLKLDAFVFVDFSFLPEHSYYDNKELMADYKNLLIDFFKAAYPESSAEQIVTRVDRFLAFEKAFIDIYPKPEVMRQRWSEKRQELQKDFFAKYPKAQFEKLFKNVPKQTLVSNSIPEALKFYNESLEQNKVDELKDVVLFHQGLKYLDDSNPEFFKKAFDFQAKHLGGPVVRSDRQERCSRLASNTFVKELDQVLIKELFPKFPAAKFKEVAKKIRESIIAGMKRNTWLQEETRKKAILKIEKAKLYLVQPETQKEWDFFPVQKYSTKDRFENSRSINKAVLKRKIDRMKTGANLDEWLMGPLTVNAYYDPSANKFVMPMGILQYPFFNADGDLIENLGAVGAVIGHELGHGVDDQGSKYDETGKLNQWMTMKDLAEFSNRGRKLIDQFNKAGHNGVLTLGENIGDLVGLTFAYNAAFDGQEPKVEDQKRLFIAYGRLWCGVARPKAEEQLLKTDPHALGRARINEQVKHQPAFAKAFNCKAGDKMTLPEQERVQIW
jgi:putative endopeptidase